MQEDEDKFDDAVLGLLRLTLHDNFYAWKGFAWDALDRLHAKGMIENPRSKAKSVMFTDEGLGTLGGAIYGPVHEDVLNVRRWILGPKCFDPAQSSLERQRTIVTERR